MSSNKYIEDLIDKIKKGDTNSFGLIYDYYLTEIYRFIYYKVNHKETAEDLTEDAFFKAFIKLKTYQNTDNNFSAWLYQIAKNTVIDYFRKEKINLEEMKFDILDEKMDAQEQTKNFYEQKLINKALSLLPENQKEVVVLKYVNDLNNEEISKIIEKSNSATRTLLSRSLKKLKELIEKFEK
jgi:RNA polymerase sigma-70 factor (ECF subfamily)